MEHTATSSCSSFCESFNTPPSHNYLGPAGLGEGCGVGRAELNSIQSNILSSAKPSIAKQCLVILIYLYIYILAEPSGIQSNILSSTKLCIAKQCLIILIYLYIYTSRA